MMINIQPKPYRLLGKIQKYEWGTRGEGAYIPNLLGIKNESDTPYAEYWIGIHPKAPSEIEIGGSFYSLSEILKENPIKLLGERIRTKFGDTIPFLLKILSINQALSIQAHPNKELARQLHAEDPDNYPDENHKPEIAIAIDNLTALVGLKKKNEIIKALNYYPELKKLLSERIIEEIENEDFDDHNLTRLVYSEIMNAELNIVDECIKMLIQRISGKLDKSQAEDLFLKQNQIYGNDIGLISILLFNIINLYPDEAIYTPAGIPHAYISGNIVECMANSDNVVRAGLTPKYKDIETLLTMLETDSSLADVKVQQLENSVVYKTSAEEFEIEKLLFNEVIKIEQNADLFLLLILNGELIINYSGNRKIYNKGEVILIPSILNNLTLEGNSSSRVFKINVPK